jgi:hypothetical protein
MEESIAVNLLYIGYPYAHVNVTGGNLFEVFGIWGN